jgi:hypothetical protein
MDQIPRAPRFRLVIDMTVEGADPSEYDQVMVRLKQGMEAMSACTCKEVNIREYLTLGDRDDYSDWRYHRGYYYDPSQHQPSISFSPPIGPIPTVDAGDLKALWVLMTHGRFNRDDTSGTANISTTEIVEACSAGADITAVMARLISLESIVSAGLLSDWCRGTDFDESVFRIAAEFPLEQVGGFDRDALVQALRRDIHTQ